MEISAADLLLWRRAQLADGGDRAELDWLLELAGGLSWRQLQELALHPERTLALACSLEAIAALWRRHRQGSEPLQYLVGRCPWRDLELAVGPGVLIPRQETEGLVDLALALRPPVPESALLWADLGTGSGCLALALALALPAARGVAVDRSEAALAQAALNLERISAGRISAGRSSAGGAAAAVPLQERLTLLRSDWWEGLAPWWGRLDLVVSNPPYIPSTLLPALDPVVRDHEPRLALDGGSDGLAAIRVIIAGAATALAPGGVLLLEHHHDQSPRVLELLAAAGLAEVRAHPDLEGVQRFASGVRPLR